MSDVEILPEVTQGVAEPEASRVILAILGLGVLGLVGMFSVIFGWDGFPLLSELIPLFDALGSSGIWYYLVGIILGFSFMVLNLLGEVFRD
ncbi:MAG: hypothetical protein CMB49_03515 [Euryarchaeota archaeon]|jgi:hypothetical protein|nr:hypothetical protein [Euryarchaeota archaeon]|tara:strand:+ start:169 stop:441 length:273 start_codon:yes stop_codon:yes gene_type:complete